MTTTDEVTVAIRQAINDPGRFVKRDRHVGAWGDTEYETLGNWGARAVVASVVQPLLDRAKCPRVFFDGDEIPEGVRVITADGDVYPDADELDEPWINSNLGPLVELVVDFDAEVARAEAKRGA